MIAIRVDMNNQIATGHLMRCLSIAEALRFHNEEVMFIVADEQPIEFLSQRNFRYIVLNTQWNNMESEVKELTKIIIDKNIDKLLIDSYQVTYKYLNEISNITKTIYIDDLGKFEYPVNTVICYANYWKKLGYDLNNTKTKYFLGTKYVPLRKEFWNIKNKHISDDVENVLIMTGGSDPYNIVGLMLCGIDRSKYKKIDVICGRYNSNYNDLVAGYRNESNVSIHRNVSNMEDYMMNADIAISAGGTTLYELCACGIPTISYTFVDNQIDNAKQFDEDGLIRYAGDVRDGDIVKSINSILNKMKDDYKLRKDMSHRMQLCVDGRGTMRVADIMCEKCI